MTKNKQKAPPPPPLDNNESLLKALAEFKEKANIQKGKDKVDEGEDAEFHRFLRARQYNVDKAVIMYTEYVKWRKENTVDEVLNAPFGVEKEKWKHSFHGRDREGRPLFIEYTGELDVKAIVGKDVKMDTLVRAHIYQQEYLVKLTEAASKEEGRQIEQTLSILDLDNAGVRSHLNSHAREFFGILAGIAQNYYPERLFKLIVVNAPRTFPMAWNFVKPLLDVNTQTKIIIPYQKDQLKVLLEHIEPCFIPEKFGGQCKCEKRGCVTSPNPPIFADALRYEEGTRKGEEEIEEGEGRAVELRDEQGSGEKGEEEKEEREGDGDEREGLEEVEGVGESK